MPAISLFDLPNELLIMIAKKLPTGGLSDLIIACPSHQPLFITIFDHILTNKYQSRAIFYAMRTKDTRLLKALLHHGVDVNGTYTLHQYNDGSPFQYHGTPLQYATEHAYPHIVRLLLTSGADPDSRSPDGDTPLHCAVYARRLPGPRKDRKFLTIARELLQHGADVHARDKGGRTPLHRAITGSIRDARWMIKLLVLHGAAVDARDAGGQTPLMQALYGARQYPGRITALQEAGASMNVKDDMGVSPQMYVDKHYKIRGKTLGWRTRVWRRVCKD